MNILYQWIIEDRTACPTRDDEPVVAELLPVKGGAQ